MRKYLEIYCTKEESDSLKLISNRITCADQALNADNIHLFPNMTPEERTFVEEQGKIFVMNALEYKAQAQFLLSDWWSSMKQKYNLQEETQIDTNTFEFYISN